MRVAVLSDLHLSMPGESCAFKHGADRLVNLIDEVASKHERLVLAGDVFDHDVGPNPFARRAELRKIRRAWADVLCRVTAAGGLMVWGNHDPLQADYGACEAIDISYGGRRLRVMHGHQLLGEGPVLTGAKVGVKWIAGVLQRTHGGGLAGALYRINHAFGNRPTRAGQTERAVDYLVRHREVDILVCGHAHRPEIVQTPHGIYANSGAGAYERLDVLTVDMDTGKVTLTEYA